MPQHEWKTGGPARQGFYRVQTNLNVELVAEWREQHKGEGKRWWQYVTDDPTVQKQAVPLEGVTAYTSASRDEVATLLRRELTREEKIQKAYEAFLSMSSDWVAVPQPERRRPSIGQKVIAGNLKSPVVVAIHDEGQVVTCSYQATRKEHGVEVPAGENFGTWHWVDLLPVRETKSRVMATNRRSINYVSTGLDHLIHTYYGNGMKADTRYQRGYVWTQDDKDRLIDSLVKGREIGRFILVRNPYPHVDDILDGKQRLDALVGFFSSQFPYKGVYWDEMNPLDRNVIENRGVQYAQLDAEQLTEVELLDIFLEANAAGVPQTREHLAHVEALRDEARAREIAGGDSSAKAG